MRQTPLIAVGIIVAIAAFIVTQSTFIVTEKQFAQVLQFSDPVRSVEKPGLHFKLPIVQNVVMISDQIQSEDPDPQDLILSDQRRVSVDYYVLYRVADVTRYYQSFLGVESSARARLVNTTNSQIREALGQAGLADLLSARRLELVEEVQRNVQGEMNRFGIDIIDIKIGKADLLDVNQEQVFERMRSDRVKEAEALRADGRQAAAEIRAATDREAREIRAAARQRAETLRGEGDQFRITELDSAYALNPQFASCYLAIRSYDTVLANNSTQTDDTTTGTDRPPSNIRLLLTTDNAFFNAFQNGCGSLAAL